ncbi:MAG: MBOAT family protein [Bacteroidetes bacterium]|nr:MBOAT family protein [Bacteroidota bacterium]
MIFNSFPFVFFFIIVTAAYFILPHKFRWFLLLAASCYFYMFFYPVYILILAFTIVIDYFAGIYLEKTPRPKKKLYLIYSLIANIGVLAFFKYYNFLNENLTIAMGTVHLKNSLPFLTILLPIGLSFHTFQAMSYTIEVYRGKQKAERHFGIYALYVMFYPQLVAGPIERPQNLLHQFYEKHEFEIKRVVSGLRLMLWGFFKKIVIADRLSIYVNAVYTNVENHSGLTFILATIFFAFQIYCDFSGYSDIAIGSARVMGFDLMTNFNRPYFSRSIHEFWGRWHISLSTWFKDYFYIPLGGNRVAIPRLYFNLFIVFLISGLWHGANWTYLIWGGLNGLYLVFLLATKNIRTKIANAIFGNKFHSLRNLLSILITFAFVSISWIFFRANNVHDGFYILSSILKLHGPLFIDATNITYSLMGILILLIIEFRQEYSGAKFKFMNNENVVVRYSIYLMLIFLIIIFGVFDGGQFIYFQF